MIFTDRTIIVQKGTSSINDTIILYRGDRDIEVRFTLNEGSPFKFGSGANPNIIEKTEAAYGQLIIKTPNDLPAIFSEVAPTNNGKIVFTITTEMIDEITEVGNYTFQIRLLDESRNSRATLPEVVNGIEIREPIATEDISDTNEVGIAAVGYALTTAGTTEDTFDSQGNYNKTTWGTGDRITAAKLNKIEAGIEGVNQKVASGGTGGGSNINDTIASANTTYSSNKIESIKENLSSQIKEIANQVDNVGQPTDTQINNAVNSYFANNPIELNDMWSDVVDDEIYEVTLSPKQTGISVQFIQGDTTIYAESTLDSLKSMLTVNKVYNDESTKETTDYTLSGSLTVGTSVITVTSGSYIATFDVTVSEKPSVTLTGITATYTQGDTIIYPSASLDDLKSNLVVTATYSDDTTATVTNYALSGTLTQGTSTITVTYEGLTATFDVTVSERSSIILDSLILDYDNITTNTTIDNNCNFMNPTVSDWTIMCKCTRMDGSANYATSLGSIEYPIQCHISWKNIMNLTYRNTSGNYVSTKTANIDTSLYDTTGKSLVILVKCQDSVCECYINQTQIMSFTYEGVYENLANINLLGTAGNKINKYLYYNKALNDNEIATNYNALESF